MSIQATEPFGASDPPPQPAGGGQLGSDTTKAFVMSGQILSQTSDIEPVVEPGVSPSGGPGNVGSEDDSTPERLNPTQGANPGVKGQGLGHNTTGVIKAGLPPGFGPTRGKGR